MMFTLCRSWVKRVNSRHPDWPLQKERIAEFVKRWNALLVMDATGVGDPVYDDLRRVLPRVEVFKITAQSKRELVQGLMVAVLPEGLEIDREELDLFEEAAADLGFALHGLEVEAERQGAQLLPRAA